jgi:hypothetical protein
MSANPFLPWRSSTSVFCPWTRLCVCGCFKGQNGMESCFVVVKAKLGKPHSFCWLLLGHTLGVLSHCKKLGDTEPPMWRVYVKGKCGRCLRTLPQLFHPEVLETDEWINLWGGPVAASLPVARGTWARTTYRAHSMCFQNQNKWQLIIVLGDLLQSHQYPEQCISQGFFFFFFFDGTGIW